MKRMAKWKKVASESQKKFFKDMKQFLFENSDAEERFNMSITFYKSLETR